MTLEFSKSWSNVLNFQICLMLWILNREFGSWACNFRWNVFLNNLKTTRIYDIVWFWWTLNHLPILKDTFSLVQNLVNLIQLHKALLQLLLSLLLLFHHLILVLMILLRFIALAFFAVFNHGMVWELVLSFHIQVVFDCLELLFKHGLHEFQLVGLSL